VTCAIGGWTRRQKLTIDNTGQPETFTNFPVLVRIDGTSITYSDTQPVGQDLRFVNSDGTVLAHEIEVWNTSGASVVWVNIPSIEASSSADHFWMYYGNPNAPDGQDVAGTWNAGYQGVWHMSETSGPLVDSARGISCAWVAGGGTQGAVGQIGRASSFDGVNTRANCGTDRIADTVDSTISAWVNMPLTGDADQEVVAIENLNGSYQGIALYVQRSNGAIGKWLSNSYHFATLAQNLVAANTWAFAAIRGHKAASGGTVAVSQNGGAWETVISGNTNNLAVPTGTPLVLGAWTGGGPSAKARGVIDEIRVSNVARSDPWMRAEYRSMSGGFVTSGGEQACP